MAETLLNRLHRALQSGHTFVEGRKEKIDKTSIAVLRSKLKKARPFRYTAAVETAIMDLVNERALLVELLPRARLLFPVMWVEAFDAAADELAEDTINIGILFEAITDTKFKATIFDFQVNENLFPTWDPVTIQIDPINNIVGTDRNTLINYIDRPVMQYAKLFGESGGRFEDEELIKISALKLNITSMEEAQTWVKNNLALFSHIDYVASAFPRSTLEERLFKTTYQNSEIAEMNKKLSGQIRQDAIVAMSIITVLNLGGKLQPLITPNEQSALWVKPKAEYLQHNIISMRLTSQQISRQINRLVTGMGVKHIRHEVIAHWCVSRKKGKAECAESPRVCKPIAVNSRRNNCEYCERYEWRRDNHGLPFMRGDATLGFSIQQRIVDK